MKKISKLFVFIVLLVVGVNVFAQTSGLKITSVHPNLKMKITRCEAIGRTAVIDFVLENISGNDVRVALGPGKIDLDPGSAAYDDEGNVFTGTDFKIKLGSSPLASHSAIEQTLPSEVPIKGRIQIDGIPESAQMFRRVDIWTVIRDWGIWRQKMKVVNIPIFREGDE